MIHVIESRLVLQGADLEETRIISFSVEFRYRTFDNMWKRRTELLHEQEKGENIPCNFAEQRNFK
jgi:hypothetical protein